jgi:hypothetical protein
MPGRIINITREPSEDRLTQHYYDLLQKRQAEAHGHYAEVVHELYIVSERLKSGADEEMGKYYFDRDRLLIGTRPDGPVQPKKMNVGSDARASRGQTRRGKGK